MKKKKKNPIVKILLLILAVAVVVGLAVLPKLSSNKKSSSSGASITVLSGKAERREIDTVLLGGGQLDSSGVYNMKIPENIKIKEFLVGNGDTVKEGDPIALIDSVSVMTAITKVQDTLNELADKITGADSSSTTSILYTKPGGRVKKVYAQKGDSVEDVMLAHGALAVISLDDLMAVDVEASTSLVPGDKVSVTVNGKTVAGRVRANVSGKLTVSIDDDGYPLDTPVTVTMTDGSPIGTGSLYVYNAWNATAYSGIISNVYTKEEQTIYANQALFAVTEAGKAADYQKNIDKRQKYEKLMQELFQMYSTGVISSPCDGIVSGIDTDGTFMLSSETDGSGVQLMLLSEESYEVVIVTDKLADGTVGQYYTAFLQAASGETVLSGLWTVVGLPDGLSYDPASGLISGTPNRATSTPATIQIAFECEDGSAYTELTLNIAEGKSLYSGYLAQVTTAGGDFIAVKQTSYAYTLSDINMLPAVNVNPKDLTEEAAYQEQAVTKVKLSVGDTIWLIFDESENLVKISKVNGAASGNTTPSGANSGGSSGITRPAEDDGLYSLDTVTVATVTSQEQMTVNISIDELDINKVFVGQKAQITMNAFAGEPVEATVKKIANSGENSGGNSKFTVELELGKSSDMLPGMNATATITLDKAIDVLSVPAAAIYEVDGQTVVYTAVDPKTNALTSPVNVTISRADADYVQIEAGLSENDTFYYEIYEAETFPAMPA